MDDQIIANGGHYSSNTIIAIACPLPALKNLTDIKQYK